jgi:cell division inhibitor SepF
MPNAVRKMAEYLGLVADTSYDEYETYQDDAYNTAVVPTPAYASPVATAPSYSAPTPSYSAPTPSYSTPATAPTAAPRVQQEVYRITTIHPRSFNDARRIGEDFRTGTPVIMNLSEMDDSDARRIVDFAAGLALGLHGALERVTKGVFLLSPANVDIGAAARAQLREDPFFNQS